MSIIYEGTTKAGTTKRIRSSKSERKDIERLYKLFTGETVITCYDPGLPDEKLDEIKLKYIFNEPKS